jgi:hypothetical protein
MLKQQRTPLILLAIAGLLGAGVYWAESRKVPTPAIGRSVDATSQPIVPAPETDIQALSIKTLVQTIVLDKTGPTWTLRSPKPEGPASDASVAYLTSLVVGKGDRLATVMANRKAEFGFDQPLATIEVRLPNQQIQTIVLGKLNFNRTGLYAVVNPSPDPNTPLPVMLVSPSFESAVTRSIEEWRKTPPKPSAKPTSKPST